MAKIRVIKAIHTYNVGDEFEADPTDNEVRALVALEYFEVAHDPAPKRAAATPLPPQPPPPAVSQAEAPVPQEQPRKQYKRPVDPMTTENSGLVPAPKENRG